jgi:hypothetical protein
MKRTSAWEGPRKYRVGHRRSCLVRVPSEGLSYLERPWDSRAALLEEIRQLDSARPIIDAFEAVGVSRPVTLRQEQKGHSCR